MEGTLFLEDGQIYRGKGFGAPATNTGELIFNTSMGGYQEILTDPASKGLIINMTYPLIGNYGISEIDNESDDIHASGLVTRDISFRPSNRMSVMSISEWLRVHGVPGVFNVDTRAITKTIRSNGTMKCVISTEGISKERAFDLINKPQMTDYIENSGVTLRVFRPGSLAETAPGRGLKITVLDFGIKKSIVRALTDLGCDVVLCPHDTTAEEILSMDPDGLLLSSGPGDPQKAVKGIETVSALIDRLPIMGICFGHLVLALAAGGGIYKLKFGHHGANHGVKDLDSEKSAITSQGHSFVVDADTMKDSKMIVTHLNLNDGTVEGIRHKSLPVFSVGFHPEGSPGSCDSKEIFERYIKMVKDARSGAWKGGGGNV
jgi:carbamoyl-phosphate synthase small subunit